MIYRGVKLDAADRKRRNLRDAVKAVLYSALAVGAVGAAVAVVRHFSAV